MIRGCFGASRFWTLRQLLRQSWLRVAHKRTWRHHGSNRSNTQFSADEQQLGVGCSGLHQSARQGGGVSYFPCSIRAAIFNSWSKSHVGGRPRGEIDLKNPHEAEDRIRYLARVIIAMLIVFGVNSFANDRRPVTSLARAAARVSIAIPSSAFEPRVGPACIYERSFSGTRCVDREPGSPSWEGLRRLKQIAEGHR